MTTPLRDAVAVTRALTADQDTVLVPALTAFTDDDLVELAMNLAALVVLARTTAPGLPLGDWLDAVARYEPDTSPSAGGVT